MGYGLEPKPKDENQQLIESTGEAFNRLKEKAEGVKNMIGSKEAAMLESKIKEAKENLDALHKMLNSFKSAKQKVGGLLKSGKGLPASLATHLTELNKSVACKVTEVKKLSEMTEHKAADNSVCEYITMVNEACAAFSTITNFWTLSLKAVLLNITLDKRCSKRRGNS